uniref:Cytochrome c-552/4 domain-containing protein n=1 Tax=Eiseniibacteriota bacterium TaxID=2212470 RepID=A0A832I313_UNCEI
MKKTYVMLAASVMALGLFAASWSSAQEAAKATYAGNAKCKMCHMKVHTAWAATAHSKAFENLTKADAKVTAEWAAKMKVEVKGAAKDADGCVGCHVVGHKQGGWPQADATKNAAFEGVGCESCHGPGSLHIASKPADKKATMATAVTAETCTGCHTKEASPNFKFEEAKKTGVHAVPAAAPAAK